MKTLKEIPMKSKSILNEFKNFAMHGNVIDMAVGIIIGAAFGKVVSSLVSDLVMPPIGMLLGGVDFRNLQILLKESIGDTPAVAIRYGAFFNTLIDFLIIAFSIFIVIKTINMLRQKGNSPVLSKIPTKEVQLLTEIRDLLKKEIDKK